VELPDRLVRFGAEHLRAALAASGRRLVAGEGEETTNDLIGDPIEVGTWMCSLPPRQCAAKNRAERAIAVSTGQAAQ
jgi:putative resolvase